jgi:hypothetical protein
MIVFIVTTMVFGILGIIIEISNSVRNIGYFYYLSLSIFSIVVYKVLPIFVSYLSNILLFYTLIIIFCYSIYTAESESL